MEFFNGYRDLKCDHAQFEILWPYLQAAGWDWHGGTCSGGPIEELAMIQPAPTHGNGKETKLFIGYFQDEIEFISFDKDAKDLIREIRLKELGI